MPLQAAFLAEVMLMFLFLRTANLYKDFLFPKGKSAFLHTSVMPDEFLHHQCSMSQGRAKSFALFPTVKALVWVLPHAFPWYNTGASYLSPASPADRLHKKQGTQSNLSASGGDGTQSKRPRKQQPARIRTCLAGFPNKYLPLLSKAVVQVCNMERLKVLILRAQACWERYGTDEKSNNPCMWANPGSDSKK